MKGISYILHNSLFNFQHKRFSGFTLYAFVYKTKVQWHYLTLRGRGLCQRGGGVKIIKSTEGLSKSFLACFGVLVIFLLKLFASEASEVNFEKTGVLGIQKL